jgi:hypothetical protein
MSNSLFGRRHDLCTRRHTGLQRAAQLPGGPAISTFMRTAPLAQAPVRPHPWPQGSGADAVERPVDRDVRIVPPSDRSDPWFHMVVHL